jgi:hypothetical protein
MDHSITTVESMPPTPVDCACVIHGDAYSWIYVERLYNMLSRHISRGIQLHVYTELERPVPAPMIKHVLPAWGIHGPKRSWWYKMNLFDSAQHAGPLLYFDLDTVIVDNIDWICDLPLSYFWAVQDFKYLWRPGHLSINSSIMWWDTRRFDSVWTTFTQENLATVIKKYRGDQDYISYAIDNKDQRFLDPERVKSWRWQCLGNGYNFKQRNHQTFDAGTVLHPGTCVLVFHGQPKPADLHDPVITQHWQ